MDSIVKTVSYEEAKSIISETSYALLYKIEEIELHKMNAGEDIDALLMECYDARFFNDNCEVRLLRESVEGGSSAWISAFIIEEPKGSPCVSQDKVYTLDNQYQKMGKTVTVRQYLLPDKDGQMCIQATRLVRIER